MADEDFIVRLEFDARQPQQAMEALSRGAAQARAAMAGTAGATDQYAKGLNGVERAAAKGAQGLGSVVGAAKSANQSLSTTRYALYDVSNSLGIAGLAMVGLSAATFAVGIAWEKNFATVVRTSGIYEDGAVAVNRMRNEFMELGQELPVATRELAEIGALGGQLGIEAQGIDEFTEVVAKLTATTDLSADAAGTALGRFNALFEDIDPSNFENLASAILKVGVNSVATETQIVNISTQISSMGNFAGLTAEQVVGLSGALASVGAQPELSRGTITRVFTLMSRAVQQGGEKLDEFARISGVSSDQFRNSWGTAAFSDTFQAFLRGVSSEGENAVAALNGLGVSSVRDVPLLLRLADAGNVVKKSFDNAASGFEENTELANQYGIITETTAAKLQILANNFEIFLVALSDGGTVFGGLIDGLTGVLRVMTDIAQNPVMGSLAQIILVGGIVTGVLLLLASAGARTFASIAALHQAMIGLGVQMPITGGAAAALSGTLQAVGLSANAAATATKVLGVAIKSLTVVGAFLALGKLSDVINGWQEAASGTDSSFSGLVGNLTEVQKVMRTFDNDSKESGAGIPRTVQKLVDAGREIDHFVARGKGAWAQANQDISTFFNDLGWYATSSERDFKRVDEAMRTAAEAGDFDALGAQFDVLAKESGLSLNEIISTFPRLRAALEESGISVTKASDGMYKFKDASGKAVEGINAVAQAEEEAAAKAELFANKIGFASGEALTTFQENLASGSSGFVQFGDIIQRVQDQTRAFAEKQSTDAYGSKDSWQEFYDGSSVNIRSFMTILDEQIAKQGVWADDMAALTARGATSFVTELAKMGPEGAPLAAAAVKLTSDELMKLEDQAALAAFLASSAFAQTFTDNTPVLIEAYRAGGIEAVEAMIVALRTGSAEVEAVANEYGMKLDQNPLTIRVTISGLNEARTALQALLRTSTGNKSLHIAAGAGGQGGMTLATGGPVYGRGTGTSDSIPAMLSNGEYVIKASAVRALGLGYLNAVNQGRKPRHFATGGPVGGSGGSGSIGVGIMELGPKSLGRMGGSPTVNIYLDDNAIARAANRGNENMRGQGY